MLQVFIVHWLLAAGPSSDHGSPLCDSHSMVAVPLFVHITTNIPSFVLPCIVTSLELEQCCIKHKVEAVAVFCFWWRNEKRSLTNCRYYRYLIYYLSFTAASRWSRSHANFINDNAKANMYSYPAIVQPDNRCLDVCAKLKVTTNILHQLNGALTWLNVENFALITQTQRWQ